jgi:hypothetical protein
MFVQGVSEYLNGQIWEKFPRIRPPQGREQWGEISIPKAVGVSLLLKIALS